MNDQSGNDNVREPLIRRLLQFVFKNKKQPETDLESRSEPLATNGYNSIFIVLVLCIAAIVALIILVWPSGGF